MGYEGTLLELVERNAADHADLTATVDGPDRRSWAAYRRRAMAIGLALLDLGVRPGDTVGLHMVNRAEHVQSDLGALYAGGTPTSFYNTLAADELAYVAEDSGAVVAIVDAEYLPVWQSIREKLPALRHLVVLDSTELTSGDVHRFEDLVGAAEAGLDAREAEVAAAAAQLRPDGALTIVYTSGTTGHPKGTVITHDGVRFVMEGVAERAAESGRPLPDPGAAALSYLPLAHVAERMFSHYLAIRQVITVTYVRDHRKVAEALPSVRPHVFLGVPRIWEKMYGTIRDRATTASSPVRKALGTAAVSVAASAGAAIVAGRSPDLVTRLAHPILDGLVFAKIRAALGLDRVVMAASGAAPLAPDVMAFFAGLGITITEAYGMTETSAVITVTDTPRPGSVGRALPGVELRLADDGEVLVRGRNITPGYLNRPEATAEAIDGEHWLHTGDIGTLDPDGYLSITGRKKELIINAAGKNISPANVELAVSSTSDLIGPVYVHGDQRPYLVALLTLDPLSWADWCKARGVQVDDVAAAAKDPTVLAEAARAVAQGNEKLARVEQIKRWKLLDHVWDPTSGELTPTLKLKRPVVVQRYAADIDELYS